jgi:hypothetical protein
VATILKLKPFHGSGFVYVNADKIMVTPVPSGPGATSRSKVTTKSSP